MNTAKIGAIFLISIMALAGIGAGYAAWTDTITIDGTVNTGNVDIDIEKVSSTWVYKVLGAGDTGYGPETVVHHDWGSTDPTPPEGTEGEDYWLVASAIATDNDPTGETNTLTFTYSGLLPCIDFTVDFLMHYDGSIPVKINKADFTVDASSDSALIALWVAGEQVDGTGAWIDWYWSDETGVQNEEKLITDPLGIQLHKCNYILIVGHIHLPQSNDLMGLYGIFTATFEVVQWNEYPYIPT